MQDYQENYYTGWIRIYRSLKLKGWYNKPDYVALWVYLLIEATHKPMEYYWNGKTITLDEGQFITGRKRISDETGISENKVQRILNFFENEQQIEQQTSSTSRLISILNYKQYQKGEQPFKQRVNNERTTSEQRVNTKQEHNNIRIKEYNSEFDVFWDKYSKKVGSKEKCIKVWNKLSDSDKSKIFTTLPIFLNSITDKKYQPHPLTYLNNKRWNDEIALPKQPTYPIYNPQEGCI